MRGAEILLDCLKREGECSLWHFPARAILPICLDALSSKKISWGILTLRHEQGPATLAGSYARATGKVGCVVLATSGPGAANLVTAITDALDSTPIVAITGQVAQISACFQECQYLRHHVPHQSTNYLVQARRGSRIIRKRFALPHRTLAQSWWTSPRGCR